MVEKGNAQVSFLTMMLPDKPLQSRNWGSPLDNVPAFLIHIA